MEWLANPFVLWLTVLIVFMVLIATLEILLTTNAVWILFEFYRAAVGDEDDSGSA